MSKQATLYRMVMPEHTCPYGLKAKDLLEREGFTVDDHWLKTREETDAFKAEQHVATTRNASAAMTIFAGISAKPSRTPKPSLTRLSSRFLQ